MLPVRTSRRQTRATEISEMGDTLKAMQSKQTAFDKKLRQLSGTSTENKRDIQELEQRNEALCISIDSLRESWEATRAAIKCKIQETNTAVTSNQAAVENRTLWGWMIASAILLILLAVSCYLFKRVKKGSTSIDEVRKAQDALQATQTKMQEEAVKLDNKMMELCEQQIQSASKKAESAPTGHSLVLKVADEIVRIEMNLSRMDSSIRGYKQLVKAVQRIKDNFNANGYEIVDMLGKAYNPGMKAAVTFVTDESLENGRQIITKIIKPQINYHSQMIQAAQIEVSQPE